MDEQTRRALLALSDALQAMIPEGVTTEARISALMHLDEFFEVMRGPRPADEPMPDPLYGRR